MRYIVFTLLALGTISASGQTVYNKFKWDEKPVLHPVDKKYESAGAVYVVDDRIDEYAIEKDGFFMYRTLHRIVHLNNDKGIESFNKIYLPFEEGIQVTDVRARTILPNGKIVEMDKNNIKDLKDDDGQYKIFALEGLSQGCEVEYYFTLKKNPSFFGREILSSRVPAMKTHFELIAPEHLIFQTKSYNNLPDSRDSVASEKRYLIINDEKVDEAQEEKYSMYQANLKRVEYKLSYNKAKNEQDRLFTWSELAKKVYEVYTSVNDKDNKKIKDLLSTIDPKGTAIEKATAIENFLKKNFIVRNDISDDDADDLSKVIKNKVASEKAIAKIYTALFSAAGIEYQIVLGGDRTDYVVERNFENWNNTKNFLFYFPETKKFMAPTQVEYRYPWIPPTWAATNGLYCIGTTIGNFTTALAEVKAIPMEDVDRSFINMDVRLKIDRDETLMMDVKQAYGGYAASNYRAPFVFFPADQQDKLLKEMIKFGTNSENILSHSFENKEMEQTDPYLPFVINASVKSTSLMERAGQKLLLKIGEVIGQQAEMYETKPRATGIDVGFAHTLVRTIELIVPAGYQVKNLSELKINEVYKEKEKETMGFASNYELNGNILKITIRENYNLVNYSSEQYEQFKKVINAAADFNKVELILDKAG